MKLWIEASALINDKRALKDGAQYGVKRLQKLGHEICYKKEDLDPEHLQGLSNGLISPDTFSHTDADAVISAKDESLRLKSKEELITEASDWISLSDKICFPNRTAVHNRITSETRISVSLNLDGSGQASVSTGLGFLDHMLEQIARHGLIDLELDCDGDLDIDEHHTIEDVAITLGEAILKALDRKLGIQRYAFALPMDESQVTVLLDLSGRPYLVFEGSFDREMVGDFPTEMAEHFFHSLAMNLKATLHIIVKGRNDHHKIEACFKGFARCLRAVISRSERNLNILPSTKDLL